MNLTVGGEVLPAGINGGAQVHRHHFGAVLEDNFREAPRPTTRVQHQLPLQGSRVPLGDGIESIARECRPVLRIHLKPREFVPLSSERGCIVLRSDESRDASQDWKYLLAFGTTQGAFFDFALALQLDCQIKPAVALRAG